MIPKFQFGFRGTHKPCGHDFIMDFSNFSNGFLLHKIINKMIHKGESGPGVKMSKKLSTWFMDDQN